MILDGIKPPHSRELFAEILHATFDWADFVQPLEISFSGITPTTNHMEVNHVFRFVSRRDLPEYEPDGKPWEVSVSNKDISNYRKYCLKLRNQLTLNVVRPSVHF